MIEMPFVLFPLSFFFDQLIDFLPQGVRLVNLAIDIVLGQHNSSIVSFKFLY